MNPPRIEALGDDALLVRFGEVIDMATNLRVHALAGRLRRDAPAWLCDVVPAYASLAVFFHPDRMAPDAVRAWLSASCATQTADSADDGAGSTLHEIPVCYGGASGEDLANAASELGLTEEDLVARHAAPVYRVAMIGFAPGFPYLLGLDPSLALPRLASPRAHVPAGSVAIGGAQTGIYPRASPGGWRLLGRTPLRLFDAHRMEPSLLQPGDRVRFVPMDARDFARHGEAG